MGDDQKCLSLYHLGDGGFHLLLIFRIRKCSRLIENYYGAFFKNSSGQRNSLPLASRQLFSSVSGHRADSIGKFFDKFHALGFRRSFEHLFVGGGKAADPDIFQAKRY